jgi:hypothetical protein
MNCQSPDAPTFEYAVGVNEDSTCGSAASSAADQFREGACDMRFPTPGTLQTLAKTIGLTELKAHPLGRLEQARP